MSLFQCGASRGSHNEGMNDCCCKSVKDFIKKAFLVISRRNTTTGESVKRVSRGKNRVTGNSIVPVKNRYVSDEVNTNFDGNS